MAHPYLYRTQVRSFFVSNSIFGLEQNQLTQSMYVVYVADYIHEWPCGWWACSILGVVWLEPQPHLIDWHLER